MPDTEPQDAGRNAAKVQLALWLGRKAQIVMTVQTASTHSASV